MRKCLDIASFLVLYVDFQSVGHTVTHDHGGSKGENLCMLDVGSPGEYLSDDGILAVFVPFAFTPVLEADDERTAALLCPPPIML